MGAQDSHPQIAANYGPKKCRWVITVANSSNAMLLEQYNYFVLLLKDAQKQKRWIAIYQ